MNLFKKCSKKTYDWINNGGLLFVLILAFFGITFSLIGMILPFIVYGFNWMFFIFDLFIICFCGWALYQTVKLVKNNFEDFKKPLGIDEN